MENELIKINVNNINGEEANCVSARELYVNLGFEVEQGHFTDWIKKQLENVEAIENNDYLKVAFKRELSKTGQTQTDYILTVDIAKEICMVVGVAPRTTKEVKQNSKAIRKYFIECEKKLKEVVKTPQLTKEQELALKIFNGGFTAIEAYKELADIETKPLKKTIKDQEETIIDLTKKNNYLNLITDSSDTYSTREVAKHLGLKSERQLYKILINCKVIFKTKNGGYLLSGALENNGFNKYVTVVKKGEVVATQLKWTETGKLFIYDLLKEMEII